MEKYHITQLDDSFFKVLWNGRVNGREVEISGRFTYSGTSLKALCGTARSRIFAGVSAEGRKFGFKPVFTSSTLVWDEDTSGLASIFARQAQMGAGVKLIAGSLSELTDVMNKKVQPERLYEIQQVKGVWTVKKHETPLLTWDEAVEELKKKVA